MYQRKKQTGNDLTNSFSNFRSLFIYTKNSPLRCREAADYKTENTLFRRTTLSGAERGEGIRLNLRSKSARIS